MEYKIEKLPTCMVQKDISGLRCIVEVTQEAINPPNRMFSCVNTKTLLLYTIFMCIALVTNSQTMRPTHRKSAIRPVASNNVYICDSKSAYAYHSTVSCTGLSWCTHTVNSVSVAKAKKMGRYPCSRCPLLRYF